MKVLFVVNRNQIGGSQQSLKTLTSWLECDYSICYVNRGWRPAERKNVLTLFLFLSLSFWWVDLIRIRRLAQVYDVVHLNIESLIWYGIGLNRPVVCHVRSMWHSRLFSALLGLVADHLIFISENEKNQYRHCMAYESIVYNIAFSREKGNKERRNEED